MKNFLLFILIMACLLLGLVYLATNTPFVMNMMIPDIINHHVADVHMEYFRCERQKSRLPDVVGMQDIRARVRYRQRLFEIRAEELTIHNFFDFIRTREVLYLTGGGFSVETEHVSSENGRFQIVLGLSDWNPSFVDGVLLAKRFSAGPYVFDKMSSKVKADKKGLEIADIEGEFYGGDVAGKVSFDFEPRFGYTVWLEFQGIPAQSVASPYPEFFSGIHGEISGSARIVGSDQVDMFTVIASADQGALLAPDIFLKMAGAFDAEEEAELARLSRQKAFLKADKASMHMQNSRGQQVLCVFDVEQQGTGIRLKGRFPFSLDQGLDAFLFPLLTP